MNTFDTLLIIKPKNMSVPQNLISLKEFNEMRDEFNQSIKTKLGTQETDSVWWSLTDLEDYFDYIKKEARANSLSISGVRFHMVANVNGTKQLTLALTPTYEKNSVHVDFDPKLSDNNSYFEIKEQEENSLKSEEKGGVFNKGNKLP